MNTHSGLRILLCNKQMIFWTVPPAEENILTPIPPGKYVLKPRQLGCKGDRSRSIGLSESRDEGAYMHWSENLEDINVPDNNHGMYSIYYTL